ncbi:hypothetical protein NVP2275O_412 [Vibrio phage 2.275.O._10N.286.54.E11]|nr:hypothetical protein NVP2275O_412 [Vibrio phage 2.275.O._10N.286.54.E11]
MLEENNLAKDGQKWLEENYNPHSDVVVDKTYLGKTFMSVKTEEI